MRSVWQDWVSARAAAARPRRDSRRVGRPGGLCRAAGEVAAAALAAVLLWAVLPAGAQPPSDELVLPEPISSENVELRGRYAQQWKQPDGTLVVVYTGGFRLDMGPRHMSADSAVLWLAPRRSAADARKYYDLTIYLSGRAVVAEPGGTSIEDQELLVTASTFGQIAKYQDAHRPEVGEQDPLYQQAVRDRARIESAAPPPPETAPAVEVLRPAAPAPEAELAAREVRYNFPSIETAETSEGLRVFVVRRSEVQRVYFARAGGLRTPTLEIQADQAVVFPDEAFARGVGAGLGEPAPATGPAAPPAAPAPAERTAPAEPPAEEEAAEGAPLRLRGLERNIRAVYLEGDVVLSLGSSFIRARRLYYDFERDRALILDAVFRTDLPERGVPLYLRADEIRQLSAREFTADGARLSTSEFYSPHYHVGAEHIYLRDLTRRDAAGRQVGTVAGEYEARNATFNVGGWPLLWWPYARGRYDVSETALRRFRAGYSTTFGAEVETRWRLFNLLGLGQPEGYDATWRLDYYGKRGPGTGIDLDYQRPDHFGLLRSYYIYDTGRDNLGPLRRAEEEPDSKNRGRILWRHRHYLPDDWEATFEFSYISDPNFLEQYERPEFWEGKEQETLIYLKRARETDAITLLANWRLLDFVTQTEHLPDLTYRRLGDLLGPLVMYHESRIGDVRRRLDDRHFFTERRFSNEGASDVAFRTDARQELELPLKLGDVNLVPFATFRGGYWDGSPLRDGGLWRGQGTYGARSSTTFSRVFEDIESRLLDVHRIRHIVKPEVAAWWSHSNARSALLTPFDYGVETIDAFYGGLAALRQTWQTQRGGPDNWRSVDLVTLNLEVGAFGNVEERGDASNGWVNPVRPENSRTRDYFAGDAMWRISDTTSLLYDFNFDLNDRSFDRHDIALAVERLPRLAYIFGYRYAGDIDLNLVGGGWNYRLTEKHITTVRAWFDADRGDIGEVALAYVRRLPRWYVSLSFEYDRVDDDTRISLSVWPEGIPEWTIGSRRFTGLSTSTGIRP